MGTVGNGGVSVLAGLRDLGFLSASAARARSCSSIDSARVTSSCDMAEVGWKRDEMGWGWKGRRQLWKRQTRLGPTPPWGTFWMTYFIFRTTLDLRLWYAIFNRYLINKWEWEQLEWYVVLNERESEFKQYLSGYHLIPSLHQRAYQSNCKSRKHRMSQACHSRWE